MQDFRLPKISKDTYIAMDPNEGKAVNMNIDISFYNAPCFSNIEES